MKRIKSIREPVKIYGEEKSWIICTLSREDITQSDVYQDYLRLYKAKTGKEMLTDENMAEMSRILDEKLMENFWSDLEQTLEEMVEEA